MESFKIESTSTQAIQVSERYVKAYSTPDYFCLKAVLPAGSYIHVPFTNGTVDRWVIGLKQEIDPRYVTLMDLRLLSRPGTEVIPL